MIWRKISPVLVSLSCVLLFSPSLRAGAFEPLVIGAPGRGMAGAYTAVANDVWASFWNPAALGYLKKPQMAVSTEDMFGLDLVRHSDLAYAHPGVAGGTIGFTWVRLDTVSDANFLDYAENVYGFSYGRGVGRWRWGGSIKYFSVEGDRRGSGWGADLAWTGDLCPKKKVKLAVVLQDINQPELHWETGTTERLPRSAKVGLSAQPTRTLRLSLEENWRGHEKPIFRGGLSYDPYRERLTLRAGMAHSRAQEAWDIALGAGVRIKKVTVDFSWTHNDELGDTPTASVLFRF
jgi:hypothetical protein